MWWWHNNYRCDEFSRPVLDTHLLECAAVLGPAGLDDAVFCALGGPPSETIQSKIYDHAPLTPGVTIISRLIQKWNLCSFILNLLHWMVNKLYHTEINSFYIIQPCSWKKDNINVVHLYIGKTCESKLRENICSCTNEKTSCRCHFSSKLRNYIKHQLKIMNQVNLFFQVSQKIYIPHKWS